LLHFSRQQIRPVPVDHVTEAAINIREKSGFHIAGFIFKRQKFHQLPMLGMHDFAGDNPCRQTDLFSDETGKIHGFHCPGLSDEFLI
jgi:hypothetical protein